ncbi:MAG: YceI family protein [Archangium sp.]|nr:YceI family protein [Archangium sp.]MDP3155490.1 YceI family protein [Archangium sp.]MDP3573822.1 YceI family protein [Archangium sp.]
MARYDASSAEIIVFSFKEGLLSAVAHDLKLQATKFTLEVEGTSARLELDPASLRVVTAMKDGVEAPAMISSSKFGEIEKNATQEVLQSQRYGVIRFVSTEVTQTAVVGALTLHGQTHEVRGTRSGNRVEFRVDQRTFGIRPFSALFGALKVKPEVVVVVNVRPSP